MCDRERGREKEVKVKKLSLQKSLLTSSIKTIVFEPYKLYNDLECEWIISIDSSYPMDQKLQEDQKQLVAVIRRRSLEQGLCNFRFRVQDSGSGLNFNIQFFIDIGKLKAGIF